MPADDALAVGAAPEYVLTPELAEQLIAAAKSGLFKESCAICVGISPEVLDVWLRMGLSPGAVNPYRDFARVFSAQEAGAQLPYVNAWRSAASVDWRAAAAWLATRHPEAWGPKATKNASASALQSSADDAVAEEAMVAQLLTTMPAVLERLLVAAGWVRPTPAVPDPPEPR